MNTDKVEDIGLFLVILCKYTYKFKPMLIRFVQAMNIIRDRHVVMLMCFMIKYPYKELQVLHENGNL